MPLRRILSEQKQLDRAFVTSLGFDEAGIEINRLSLFFDALCDRDNHLTREHFRDFLSTVMDLSDETIAERLFTLIGQGEKGLSLRQFLYGMSILLRASYDEQLKFVFRIYDVSADGNLQREELFTFLRKDLPAMNEKEDADVVLHEFITLIFKKFDKDHDGVISFDDYKRTCAEDPTLLQCFGEVIPRLFRKRLVTSMLNGNLAILVKKTT